MNPIAGKLLSNAIEFQEFTEEFSASYFNKAWPNPPAAAEPNVSYRRAR
jgi:hypothetical protein